VIRELGHQVVVALWTPARPNFCRLDHVLSQRQAGQLGMVLGMVEHIVPARKAFRTSWNQTSKRSDPRVDLFMAFEMGEGRKLLLTILNLCVHML
jgi:hypothetical protein